ncbi:aspartate carbamoyltransferase [Patescibacteria group bacterium]|nr:aspartate carbamoyltransferase [Patescibacteria group bacterium]
MTNLKNKNIIYTQDLTKSDILKIVNTAKRFANKKSSKLLYGKVIANLFFEPSSRTRFSFETAAKKLGAETIGFSGTESTSLKKGESFEDTIKVINGYSDCIVIRHPDNGAAKRASKIANIPIINAGDGSNQHPTQMIMDIYTILESHKKINGLNVALIGDLKYGRTVHSLSIALAMFGANLYFISPSQLKMPAWVKTELKKHKAKFSEITKLSDVLNKLDILYSTRVQKERFKSMSDYNKVKNKYILNLKDFINVKKNLKIMHPLPRVNELPTEFDDTPYANYFEQAQNGLYVRQAILSLILGAIK